MCYIKKHSFECFFCFGGECEGRTRAPVSRPNTLAGCPLNHLGNSPKYSVGFVQKTVDIFRSICIITNTKCKSQAQNQIL